MKTKLIDILNRMYKKPLYKLFIILLGLPTYVVSYIGYLIAKSKNKDDANIPKIREQILKQLEEDGTKDKIFQEAREHLANKYKFFDKKMSESEFEKEVSQQAMLLFNQEIDAKAKKQYEKLNIKPNITFQDVFKNLVNSSLFMAFSIISSPLMYILVLIYSNPYVKYIFERLMMMIFVLIGVVILVFTILYLSPMDPAINILGQTATPEQIENFNKVYGLDQSYFQQLMQAIKGLLTFDMGRAYSGNEVVMEAIARKFPVTLQLTFTSLFVALILAIPAGIISAVKQYSSYDYIFMLLALLGLSIPNFWLGLVFILNFSIKSQILPATYVVGNWQSLIMPSIVLGTGLSASVARMTRSSMLEVIKQDYIVTARAKGLSRNKVVLKHALGNAMIPIVTVVGMQFGGMLGGSAVTEKVFNVNGIGTFIVDKQFIPDIPVVLAGVVYVAVIIGLANLVVDVLYAFLDPRIKSKMKNY